MRARSISEVTSLKEAHALLGLHGPADGQALTRAFRLAVKAARPDAPGGDDERFRRVIAAWRLIQQSGGARPALAAPRLRPAPSPVVSLSPLEALRGADVEVRLASRRLRVRAPAGMRSGEHLRLRGGGADGGDLYLPVLIRPGGGLKALGDDLFMTAPAPRRLLADGGRLEIETHAGPRDAWITPGFDNPPRLRMKGLGLPARGVRHAGHLFVTLAAVDDIPSAAEDLLLRFTRVWAPERAAA